MNPWIGLVHAPRAVPQEITSRTPRSYIARRLLEHGALDLPQFREITGWPTNTAAQVLFNLAKRGVVQKRREPGTRRYVYALQ